MKPKADIIVRPGCGEQCPTSAREFCTTSPFVAGMVIDIARKNDTPVRFKTDWDQLTFLQKVSAVGQSAALQQRGPCDGPVDGICPNERLVTEANLKIADINLKYNREG